MTEKCANCGQIEEEHKHDGKVAHIVDIGKAGFVHQVLCEKFIPQNPIVKMANIFAEEVLKPQNHNPQNEQVGKLLPELVRNTVSSNRNNPEDTEPEDDNSLIRKRHESDPVKTGEIREGSPHPAPSGSDNQKVKHKDCIDCGTWEGSDDASSLSDKILPCLYPYILVKDVKESVKKLKTSLLMKFSEEGGMPMANYLELVDEIIIEIFGSALI